MSLRSILLSAPLFAASGSAGAACERSRSNLDCKDEDLSGGTHHNVSDAETCCALCDADSRCNAWTVYPNQAVCYLKSGCSNPTANDGTSGGAALPPMPAPAPPAPPSRQTTSVTIDQEKWRVNGHLTFAGSLAEGTLTNSRMINGIFDDSNPSSHEMWAYPDTKVWDPERNTREFVGNMSSWRDSGLISFTLGLQGGSPFCYGNNDWVVSAFDSEGRLDPAWMSRLSLVLQEADSLGMVPIIQLFYYKQYQIVGDANRKKAVTAAIEWIAQAGYKNVIIDVFNENCDSDWAPMIDLVHEVSENLGNRLLAGTSCLGSHKPSEEVVTASDFVLIHGNGMQSSKIGDLVRDIRGMDSFKASPKPVVFNEDDHGGFGEGDDSNFKAALEVSTSWGFLCCCDADVQGDYSTGYQCPPIDWRMSGPGNCLSGPQGSDMKHGSKAEFAQMLQRVTQASATV